MSQFSPDRGEIRGIQTGLCGWKDVRGLGPNYFVAPAVEELLQSFVYDSLSDINPLVNALAANRACVVNFFDLIAVQGEYNPKPAADFVPEAVKFLQQIKEQVAIWRTGTFKALDFSVTERSVLAMISVKVSPVLFVMGFADGIPHSSQVARLCASMAQRRLKARPSEVLQAAVVGKLHDPKFEGRIDVGRQNLATHPIVAVALANAVFEDARVKKALVDYFHGNKRQARDFVIGVRDALGVNNDSWFVQMMFVYPQFVKRISEKYGPEVAAGLKAVMEGRLESAAANSRPPALPAYLHGCLAQETLDSGLRGISGVAWQKALSAAGVTGDPQTVFQQLVLAQLDGVTPAQIAAIQQSLRANPDAILTARISATRLLHHHQDVVPSGRVAATALVIADPMLLSPHKIAAVYTCPMIERLLSFCKSFDDNIRLLPVSAREVGKLWQRAVYLSMLRASDSLTGSSRVTEFASSHADSDVATDIADLRKLVTGATTWGRWATEDAASAVVALENAYVAVVNKYREEIQSGASMDKFLPSA